MLNVLTWHKLLYAADVEVLKFDSVPMRGGVLPSVAVKIAERRYRFEVWHDRYTLHCICGLIVLRREYGPVPLLDLKLQRTHVCPEQT